MPTQGESVEAHALHERGWSVSAIARHLQRDRKTVRAYLSVRRKSAGPDRFGPFEPPAFSTKGPLIWLSHSRGCELGFLVVAG